MAKPLTERLEDGLRPVLAAYDKKGAIEKVTLADQMNTKLLDAQAHIAASRRAGIRELRAMGFTLREIGEQTGLSHARIYQLEKGSDRKEK